MSTTRSIATSMPSSFSEVTGRSAIPHGMMWENIDMSGATFNAKPCIVRPRLARVPIAQIFLGFEVETPTQTPG